MDIYGIGFSNIRLPNEKNSYIYTYNPAVNLFPEEVFIHEFLHSLERIMNEYNYDIPALHDYKEYGYTEEKLIGLKKWYKDYMNKSILDKTTGVYIGLDQIIYSLKPVQESDFKYTVDVFFNKEPNNILDEIQGIFNVIIRVFSGRTP